MQFFQLWAWRDAYAGIDLGDGCRAVAEDDAGGFQANLFTQERGNVVAKLVNNPIS